MKRKGIIMNAEKYFISLELDKILKMLSDTASSADAKEDTRNNAPIIIEVNKLCEIFSIFIFHLVKLLLVQLFPPFDPQNQAFP